MDFKSKVVPTYGGPTRFTEMKSKRMSLSGSAIKQPNFAGRVHKVKFHFRVLFLYRRERL